MGFMPLFIYFDAPTMHQGSLLSHLAELIFFIMKQRKGPKTVLHRCASITLGWVGGSLGRYSRGVSWQEKVLGDVIRKAMHRCKCSLISAYGGGAFSFV